MIVVSSRSLHDQLIMPAIYSASLSTMLVVALAVVLDSIVRHGLHHVALYSRVDVSGCSFISQISARLEFLVTIVSYMLAVSTSFLRVRVTFGW